MPGGLSITVRNLFERAPGTFYQNSALELRYESLAPIYGLAESTLIVTVADKHQPYRSLYIDPESLHRGVVRKVEAHQAGRWLVGCGVPLDQKLCIVHPDTQRMCAELEIGEIWVSGSSVAKGIGESGGHARGLSSSYQRYGRRAF